MHEAVGGVEAHRLLVQQRAQELLAIVDAQPGRLIREQAERGAVRLGEAKAGEALDHPPHPLGRPLLRARVAHRAREEVLAMALEHLLRALAAHRAAQPVRLAGGVAREGFRDLHHLILEDDRAERLPQDRLERRMLVGDLIRGVFALAPAALDVGVDRPALDRSGPYDRDLDRQVLEVHRPRAQQRNSSGLRSDATTDCRLGP